MNLARSHQWVLAVLLIGVCLGYTVLSFIVPQTATALAAGFIAFVFVAFLALRLHRRA